MATPYLSEIKIVSFNFPPKGWAFCNGQLLPINQNQALFSLLGTTYGGDGRVNFALPNLQGRTPFHMGNGLTLGQLGGTTTVTLNISQLPGHSHAPTGTTLGPTATSPVGNLWCQNPTASYTGQPNTAMSPSGITATGGNQPHENMSPYLVLSFIIALQGIFPSQN
jgi:microcystin-dependent protein